MKCNDGFIVVVCLVLSQTLSDKQRLLARTHVNRLGHHVLGKPSHLPAEEEAVSSDMVEPYTLASFFLSSLVCLVFITLVLVAVTTSQGIMLMLEIVASYNSCYETDLFGQK